MPTSESTHEHSSTWREIQSEPSVWQAVLQQLPNDPGVAKLLSAQGIDEWLFVGCGTSYYLAEAAALSWTQLTGRPARVLPASEILLYPESVIAGNRKTQAMVISRSGKTSEAVRAAGVLSKKLHLPTAGITCAENSELAAACDTTIVLRDADEKSTVMTRSFTSMLITLQYLAACAAGNPDFPQELATAARQLAPRLEGIGHEVEAFVRGHNFADYVFLGQGAFYGIAREAALKVMEMSCSYSQFFHALEFRHGPKAIVTPETCLTFFLSSTGYEDEAEVLQEMKDLGGVIVTICDRATPRVKEASDLLIELGLAGNELARLAASTAPCQLLGYFTGLRKGLNPDEPRNLTRVVILD